MKKFNDEWNLADDLDFFVDICLMAVAEEKWPALQSTKDMVSKMYEEIPATETSRGTRRPTTRAERRASTRKAKRRQAEVTMIKKSHARKAEEEGWYVSINNPRGSFIRDLADKANPGDPRDRKRNRRAGKELCRRYDIPEREIIPTVDDIDPDGTWDVESQCFLWDVEKDESHYFEEIRYWDPDQGTHVVREIPNYDWAPEFIRERGLAEEFITWLKEKEVIA